MHDVEIGERGDQGGLNETLGLLRQDAAHHNNVFEHSGFPQENTLLDRGYTESPDTEFRQGFSHGPVTMAVAVGFDHR